jgi:outer membrane protein OmpA-like peptidoglycan-associated protein
MKLVTLLLLMLLGFAQFNMAQQKQNAMSNVIGVTAEAGVTSAFTDYSTNKINFTYKGSLEYYFPSTGTGNIGLRIFYQQALISGQDGPTSLTDNQILNPTHKFTTKIDMFGGGLFYTLSLSEAVYPWVDFGIQQLWFYPKDANEKNLPNYSAGTYRIHMLAYHGDVGVRVMVSKNISFNATAGLIVPTKDYLDDIQSGSSNDMLITAMAGLSYYFGRSSDSDGDGVSDSRDMCPNTPPGVKVDEDGCPLDSDGDRVPDYLDKCSDTPAGVKVDADGCPLDFDRDGVPDYLDKCSNTPAGVKVDENGCPIDADKDGIPDYLDRCPNTPVGVKVDQDGCPLDSDGDGVPDNLDKCPNTPKGVQVDSEGCPIKKETETIILPGEIESLVLSGDTNFEFNKAKLLPNAYEALKGLVSTINEHPKYKWEIGGHTDGIGSASYNTKLSKQRAQAIVDYLVSKGANRNNLKIVGYGEDKPIATNETLEGRSMNRRVEIKLLSKDN